MGFIIKADEQNPGDFSKAICFAVPDDTYKIFLATGDENLLPEVLSSKDDPIK